MLVVLGCFLLMGKACELDHSDPKLAAAIAEINDTFRQEYSVMLEDIGTRRFAAPRREAFLSMRRTLEDLGFRTVNAEGEYYLAVSAPAPTPLDDAEWTQARRADEPTLKRIATSHLGFKGRLARLEPDGLNINGVVTLIDHGDETEVTLTFRFQEVKEQPPDSILPRREYPPPTASRIGYEKIWRRFESNLAATRG